MLGSLVKSVHNTPDRLARSELNSQWSHEFFECLFKSGRIPTQIFKLSHVWINVKLSLSIQIVTPIFISVYGIHIFLEECYFLCYFSMQMYFVSSSNYKLYLCLSSSTAVQSQFWVISNMRTLAQVYIQISFNLATHISNEYFISKNKTTSVTYVVEGY